MAAGKVVVGIAIVTAVLAMLTALAAYVMLSLLAVG